MPIQKFPLVNKGIVKDVSSDLLPANGQDFYWTEGRNIRFQNGQVSRMPGFKPVYRSNNITVHTSSGSTSGVYVAPVYNVRVTKDQDSHYVYCSHHKVYDFHNGLHYDITKADTDYGASEDYTWSHTHHNGFLILNNFQDTPQVWQPVDNNQKLIDLPNFPADTRCQVIRSYKSYLIALNIQDGMTLNENRLIWSTFSTPGELPASWDISDPSNDAGEIHLSDTPGPLVDAVPLGDYMVVYKKTSTYLMQATGDDRVMTFKLVFPQVGALTKNCVAVVGNKHFVVTVDDIIMHDGFNFESIIQGKNKRHLFNTINSKRAHISFVVPNYARNEVWFCYPKKNSLWCDEAIIYDLLEGTWTFRQLPNTPNISVGFIDVSSLNEWDTYLNTIWDSARFIWNATNYNVNLLSLTMALPDKYGIFHLDSDGTLDEDGIEMNCYVERDNIMIGELNDIKVVKGCWVVADVSSIGDSVVKVEIGTRMRKGDPIFWQGPFLFNSKTDNKVDFFATGRFFSIRFSTLANADWRLNGFELDVHPARGKF